MIIVLGCLITSRTHSSHFHASISVSLLSYLPQPAEASAIQFAIREEHVAFTSALCQIVVMILVLDSVIARLTAEGHFTVARSELHSEET